MGEAVKKLKLNRQTETSPEEKLAKISPFTESSLWVSSVYWRLALHQQSFAGYYICTKNTHQIVIRL